MRTLAALLAIIGVLAIGYWVNSLRQEKKVLASRVERMERDAAADERARAAEVTRLQGLIRNERSRIAQLQATLQSVTAIGEQPPTGSINAHLLGIQSQISSLNTRLRELASESGQVKAASEDYQVSQRLQAANSRMQIHSEIESIDRTLLGLNQIPNPTPVEAAQILTLRTRREQLQNQMQAIGTVEATTIIGAQQGTRADLNDIALERENILAQIQDLQEEARFWQEEQKAGRSTVAAPARIQQLQEQIRARGAQISNYDQQLRTLTK